MTIKQEFIFITHKISKCDRKIKEHEQSIEKLKDEKEKYKNIHEILNTDICKYCQGYGKISLWYAQDECKTGTCQNCKGTGSSKGFKDHDWHFLRTENWNSIYQCLDCEEVYRDRGRDDPERRPVSGCKIVT